MNYLIDEGIMAGKGANTVISLLHHHFTVHGLEESCVHLDANNCIGQNKNNDPGICTVSETSNNI